LENGNIYAKLNKDLKNLLSKNFAILFLKVYYMDRVNKLKPTTASEYLKHINEIDNKIEILELEILKAKLEIQYKNAVLTKYKIQLRKIKSGF
jgi:hypothetical protein